MARTLLQIIQRASKRLALPRPTAVVSSSDAGVQQLHVLLEDMIAEAMTRWDWEGLKARATFTTVAAESQGKLANILGADAGFFVKMLNDTLWDETNKRPVPGPVDEEQWQIRKAMDIGGTLFVYRIHDGNLYVNPAPAAGLTFSFFWQSNAPILATDGTTKRKEFTADTDTCIFDDDFLHQGLITWWKQEKGLPYAEDLRTWELMAIAKAGASGTKPKLSLDCSAPQARPGILVPEGSWNL